MKYFAAIIVMAVWVGCLACSSSLEGNEDHFKKLCDIYTDLGSQDLSINVKEGMLAQRIKDELPDFYKEYYIHIYSMDPDQRYPTFKKLAEFEGRKDWECDAIKQYIQSILNASADSNQIDQKN